jgi:integrase
MGMAYRFQRANRNAFSIGTRVRGRMKRQIGTTPLYFYQVVRLYEDQILELKKPSTQKSWRAYLQEMIEDLGYLKMDKLSSQAIQAYFTKLSKRISGASVVTHWTALSAVLRYAVNEGYIDGFSRPVLPKVYKNSQQWWNIDQMRLMIEKSTGRLRVFLMLLTETGCRIGEALGLQTADLNIPDLTLSIKRTVYDGRPNAPKTQSSLRTLAISEELCYALRSLINPAKVDAYIFRTAVGHPWRPSTILGWLNPLYDRLGLQRKGFHAFRRGNITHLIMNLEMPESVVGQRVGHLSEGMTLGVYVQKIEGLDKKWIKKIAESIYEKSGSTD